MDPVAADLQVCRSQNPADLEVRRHGTIHFFRADITECIPSSRRRIRASMKPAAARSSRNSSNVNVPPLSVPTNMFTANKAPDKGVVRVLSMRMSRMRICPPPVKAAKRRENSCRFCARVLMDNGADPGQVRPGGERIDIEISRYQRHPFFDPGLAQSLPGLGHDLGKIEQRGPGRGKGPQKGDRPGPGTSAHVEQMPEGQRQQLGHQRSRHGSGDVVHRLDE